LGWGEGGFGGEEGGSTLKVLGGGREGELDSGGGGGWG